MKSKPTSELLRSARQAKSSKTSLMIAAMLAAGPLWAQQAPGAAAAQKSAVAESKASSSASADSPGKTPDRAAAYYHFGLAHMYEDMATNYGRPEYATRAIEEYKLALDADPSSKFLNSGLAELYLRTGRIRDAVVAAQSTLKADPDNLDAHKLLGRVYLQSLGNMQNTGPSEKVLQLAIAEYSKIVQLQPNDIESRLLLGQLYTLAHDTPRAAEQFRAAQKIDPGSENVVLNLARLYSDSGDTRQAISVLNAVPQDDRTAKIEYALGVSYDQLKESKQAIDAYSKALDLEPDNLDAERGLAQSLYDDNQMDAALKHFESIAASDPQDAQTYLRIAEIQRRQSHYDQALATLKKAKSLASDSLEINFNEALIDDSLGRYDEASQILEDLVNQTYHADGQYSDSERGNRSIFLDRLANVYREQNKTDLAIANYQKMIALGGDSAERGYQGEVDAYRDAKEYDKATAVAEQAVQALPKDKSVHLMLAGQLADTGKPEEGIKLAKAQLNGTPDDRDVEMSLAQIYTRLHRWKDAGDELDKADALSNRPEDKIYVDFLRGALAERQKHFDTAEEEFRKILAIDPNNTMTLNYLGYMLADRGVKLDEALNLVQRAVQLDPQNGAYLDSLGWVYFKMGQYALSEANLRKASERISTDPTVHDHLGELYEKTGRLKMAAAQWEQSLHEYSRTVQADAEPVDVGKVQKKLETARVKLAKGESTTSAPKQ
ncbi:MAG TPA: tetratricopeptide repeat protein [Acidobacteriaceae bacterium]|nr:tetratricopeptide repeat protein [Acidobacteriaceae bacterium]